MALYQITGIGSTGPYNGTAPLYHPGGGFSALGMNAPQQPGQMPTPAPTMPQQAAASPGGSLGGGATTGGTTTAPKAPAQTGSGLPKIPEPPNSNWTIDNMGDPTKGPRTLYSDHRNDPSLTTRSYWSGGWGKSQIPTSPTMNKPLAGFGGYGGGIPSPGVTGGALQPASGSSQLAMNAMTNRGAYGSPGTMPAPQMATPFATQAPLPQQRMMAYPY